MHHLVMINGATGQLVASAQFGLIHTYSISTCDANGNVQKTLKKDEFSNIQNNPILQTVTFPTVKTRYLKFKAERMVKAGENMNYEALGVN